MNENLDNSTQLDRLIEFCSTKDLKTYLKIEKYLDLGNGYIAKVKQRDGKLSGSVITTASEKFSDLNLRWLLTGIGNMHEASVKNSLQNDPNMQQELLNLYRQLTTTQKELENKVEEVEKLKSQKTLSTAVPTPELKPGNR